MLMESACKKKFTRLTRLSTPPNTSLLEALPSRRQANFPEGKSSPSRPIPRTPSDLATRSYQKSFLIAILEVSRSIIGRIRENGHVELPKVNMEIMRQCDALLQEQQKEDEDNIPDIRKNDKNISGDNDSTSLMSMDMRSRSRRSRRSWRRRDGQPDPSHTQ